MIEILVRIQNTEDFLELKKSLGLEANTEVVHYALRQCYKQHGIEKREE